MKRVVLLGDSIRLGYEAYVRSELAEVAFVWGPGENGQHSVNLLLRFWEWAAAQQPDVLHMNAALWDTRRVAWDEAVNIVPLNHYRDNVDTLLTMAKKHTRAKIVWATGTPNMQAPLSAGHRRIGLAGRSVDDIAPYNAVAVEVARAHGVVINDLHAFVTAEGPASILSEDGVHFTPAGCAKLGKRVADVIRPLLA